MTICFLVVGVWSATEHNFEVNGSIEYTAPDNGYTVTLDFSSGGDFEVYWYVTINGSDSYTYNDDSGTYEFTKVKTIKFSGSKNTMVPYTLHIYLSQDGNKIEQEQGTEITITSDSTFLFALSTNIVKPIIGGDTPTVTA
jgi:hypothetical protein